MSYCWARFSPVGYECSSAGDRRFSALCATLTDGRTIEEAYQLDVKGYRRHGNDWRLGKGRRPLHRVDLWQSYLALWQRWADQNPELMAELVRRTAQYRILTDRFASGPISQARALAQVLNERHSAESRRAPVANTQPAAHGCATTTPAAAQTARAPDTPSPGSCAASSADA